MNHVASTAKKLLAAGGVACGLVGFVLFADVSTAAADALPDTGSYDEQTNLAQEGCWGGISSLPVAFQVGHPGSGGCEHSRTAASYGPNGSVTSSYPG
jgi:hypothetical protein